MTVRETPMKSLRRPSDATIGGFLAAQAKLEESGELLPGISKAEDREAFGLSLQSKRRKAY